MLLQPEERQSGPVVPFVIDRSGDQRSHLYDVLDRIREARRPASQFAQLFTPVVVWGFKHRKQGHMPTFAKWTSSIPLPHGPNCRPGSHPAIGRATAEPSEPIDLGHPPSTAWKVVTCPMGSGLTLMRTYAIP